MAGKAVGLNEPVASWGNLAKPVSELQAGTQDISNGKMKCQPPFLIAFQC
jgi:hypothetical protein